MLIYQFYLSYYKTIIKLKKLKKNLYPIFIRYKFYRSHFGSSSLSDYTQLSDRLLHLLLLPRQLITMPFKIGHLTKASQETYSRHIRDLPEAVRQQFFVESFTCLEFCNQYTTLCRRKYMPLEINVLSVKTFCPQCKTRVSKLLIFPCNHALCSGCIVDYNAHIRYYRMLQRHRDMFWNRERNHHETNHHETNHHEWERRERNRHRGDHYVWHRISPHHEWQRIVDNDEDREENSDEDREEDSDEDRDETREDTRAETRDEDHEVDREEVNDEVREEVRDETPDETRDEDRGD